MPRLARVVFENVPHHVTQRGNRRQKVFFATGDYYQYLDWLHHYCVENRLEVLAYCLMTNHVHLVVVPRDKDSLHLTMRPLHMRYAQRINKSRHWCGHLWQGRYFSAPLDDRYTWSAIRYVELNPVRAQLVDRAEHYNWSSAPAHCGLKSDKVLSKKIKWQSRCNQIHDWSNWLSGGDNRDEIAVLRRNVNKGLPCGSSQFVSELEVISGRRLDYRPPGRPWPKQSEV